MQLTPEQIDRLNSTNGKATERPSKKPQEETAAKGEIESVQANQAQEDAAKALTLAVQMKSEGLHDAANRGAGQAVEEIQTEMTAYASVVLQGTEAMTQAKAVIREGLRQVEAPKPVAVDFSNFFRLPTAAKNAIGGEK